MAGIKIPDVELRVYCDCSGHVMTKCHTMLGLDGTPDYECPKCGHHIRVWMVTK